MWEVACSFRPHAGGGLGERCKLPEWDGAPAAFTFPYLLLSKTEY